MTECTHTAAKSEAGADGPIGSQAAVGSKRKHREMHAGPVEQLSHECEADIKKWEDIHIAIQLSI